jgi:hypothetical protein
MSTSNLVHLLRFDVAHRVIADSPAVTILDRVANAPDPIRELRGLVASPRFVDHTTAMRIAASARVDVASLFEEV